MRRPTAKPFRIDAVDVNYDAVPRGILLRGHVTDPTTKTGQRRIYSRLDHDQAEALITRLQQQLTAAKERD